LAPACDDPEVPPPVLYVHLSVEGGVFVVKTEGTEAWVTAADLEEDLEQLAEREGTVLISIEGGREAQPQVHALHRRVIGTGVPTRVLEDRHPAVTPLPEGVTRLMSFAHAGRVDLLSDVLTRGAVADVRDQQGTTPLMYAANRGERDAVLTLLDHGASPDAADNDGTTALMYAARGGHVEVVRALIEEGADPAATETHGWTAQQIANDEGHLEVVAVLRDLDPGNMD
jgi:Ankyrin repeats (3 copies)